MKQIAGEKNGKYQEWINGYGDEPWENSATKEFVNLVEKYAQETTNANRLKMNKTYNTAMKLEYMFLDGIYKNLKWVK